MLKDACTACGARFGNKERFWHPNKDLPVRVCGECKGLIEQNAIPKDESGADDLCRWCHEGGELVVCSRPKCLKAFCKACLVRNLGMEAYQAIADCDDWDCLLCNPPPQLTAAVQEKAREGGHSGKKGRASSGGKAKARPKVEEQAEEEAVVEEGVSMKHVKGLGKGVTRLAGCVERLCTALEGQQSVVSRLSELEATKTKLAAEVNTLRELYKSEKARNLELANRVARLETEKLQAKAREKEAKSTIRDLRAALLAQGPTSSGGTQGEGPTFSEGPAFGDTAQEGPTGQRKRPPAPHDPSAHDTKRHKQPSEAAGGDMEVAANGSGNGHGNGPMSPTNPEAPPEQPGLQRDASVATSEGDAVDVGYGQDKLQVHGAYMRPHGVTFGSWCWCLRVLLVLALCTHQHIGVLAATKPSNDRARHLRGGHTKPTKHAAISKPQRTTHHNATHGDAQHSRPVSSDHRALLSEDYFLPDPRMLHVVKRPLKPTAPSPSEIVLVVYYQDDSPAPALEITMRVVRSALRATERETSRVHVLSNHPETLRHLRHGLGGALERHRLLLDNMTNRAPHKLKAFTEAYKHASVNHAAYESFCLWRWIVIYDYIEEFRRARELQGQHGLVSGVMTIDADVLLLQSPRLLMDPLWTLQPTRDTSGVTMPIDGVILIPGACLVWSLEGLRRWVDFMVSTYQDPLLWRSRLSRYGYRFWCRDTLTHGLSCEAITSQCRKAHPDMPCEGEDGIWHLSDMHLLLGFFSEDPYKRLIETGPPRRCDKVDRLEDMGGQRVHMANGVPRIGHGPKPLCLVHFQGASKGRLAAFDDFVRRPHEGLAGLEEAEDSFVFSSTI